MRIPENGRLHRCWAADHVEQDLIPHIHHVEAEVPTVVPHCLHPEAKLLLRDVVPSMRPISAQRGAPRWAAA